MWNKTTSLFLLGDIITEEKGFLRYTMIKQKSFVGGGI